jgi:hypothetical protein
MNRPPLAIIRTLRLSLHHRPVNALAHRAGHFREITRRRHHSRTVPRPCDRRRLERLNRVGWGVCLDVLDRFEQLGVFLEEAFLEAPVFQIAVVFLEERGEAVGVGSLVVVVRVFEAEGPAEFEVFSVGFAKVCCLEVLSVVFDHFVAEAGPGEEVDCDGVLVCFLGRAWALPICELDQVRSVGVEVIFHQAVAFDGEGDSADVVLLEEHFLVHFSQDHQYGVVLVPDIQRVPAITDCFEQRSDVDHICCLTAISTHVEDFLIRLISGLPPSIVPGVSSEW